MQKLSSENKLPKKFGKEDGFSELVVFVNGCNIMVKPGIEMKLKDYDRVVIINAFAGG